MSQQNKLILDFLSEQSQTLVDGSESETWNAKPVSLAEFAETHLKESLTERQLHDCLAFFGPHSDQIFDGGSPFNIFCLLAGKGSGKDWLAALLTCYLFYVLLCMKNPQKYFGVSAIDAIDFLVVSFTAEQARDVSFYRIKEFMRQWIWLKKNYSIIDGDRYITGKGKPEILILRDSIRAHNGVRIKSEHSANESFEGYNVLFFIMSEASAFRAENKDNNGWKVYNTLRQSANSRFQGRWKGIVASYPRFDKSIDFTYQLYKKAEEDPIIFRDLVAPWEFKPKRLANKSGVMVPFENTQIPIEQQGEAEADKQAFKKMVLCQVPDSGEQVIPDDVVLTAVHKEPSLIRFENHLSLDNSVVVEMVGLDEKGRFLNEYLITVDLGEKVSATGVAIQHVDPKVGYILDAVGAWTPITEKGIPVDMQDVKNGLIALAKTLPGSVVGFDQWQSILYAAELNRQGIKTLKYHVRQDRDYGLFRKAMSAGRAKIPDDIELIRQITALKIIDGKVVLDYKKSPRKDLLDAVVGGFKILMGDEDMETVPMIPGSTYIGNNLSSFGGFILPDVRNP